MNSIHGDFELITNTNNEKIFVEPTGKMISVRYELAEFWKEIYNKASTDKKIF